MTRIETQKVLELYEINPSLLMPDTRKRVEVHRDVMQQFADGKDIEYHHGSFRFGLWEALESPGFSPANEYRVKEQTVSLKELAKKAYKECSATSDDAFFDLLRTIKDTEGITLKVSDLPSRLRELVS